jgi:hypothetical protein
MTEQIIEKIETRGRPQAPKTVEYIEALKAQIAKYEKAQASKNELLELAELIRVIQRSMKGLSADDDVFLGLINPKDIRERTRLEETALLSHSAMRIASEKWGRLKLFENIADMEDPYYISEDGEGRKEGILLQQAKTKLDANTNLTLNMPNTHGEDNQPQNSGHPKRGGLRGVVDKVLHR